MRVLIIFCGEWQRKVGHNTDGLNIREIVSLTEWHCTLDERKNTGDEKDGILYANNGVKNGNLDEFGSEFLREWFGN